MQKIKPPRIPKGHDMNNPFRAALQDGHMLNESYKLPAPNSSGTNLSYHHPLGGAKAQRQANIHPPVMKDAKNTF
jgi:hypothetical protein